MPEKIAKYPGSTFVGSLTPREANFGSFFFASENWTTFNTLPPVWPTGEKNLKRLQECSRTLLRYCAVRSVGTVGAKADAEEADGTADAKVISLKFHLIPR